MSHHLQLLHTVRDLLLAAPALAGGAVYSGRLVPAAADQAQAVALRLGRSTARLATLAAGAAAITQWRTEIVVELVARATPAQGGEAAVDALLAAVFQRIATAAVPPGVLGWALEPSLEWAIDEADTTVGQALLVLRIDHFTGADLAAYT